MDKEEKVKKILIVEDSKTQADQIRVVLKSLPHQIELSYNAKEALDKIETFKPDMLITDVIMPDIDGYDLCRMIRKKYKENIIIILLTSLSRTTDIINGFECGADYFLSKPCPEDYLLSRIKSAFLMHQEKDLSKDISDIPVLLDDTLHHVQADKKRIVDMLISSYDAAALKNKLLLETNDELSQINKDLGAIISTKSKTSKVYDLANRETMLEAMRLQKAEIISQLSESIANDFKSLLDLIRKNLNDLLKASTRLEFKSISESLKETVNKSDFIAERLLTFSKQSYVSNAGLQLEAFIAEIKNEIERISTFKVEVLMDVPKRIPNIPLNKEYILNSLVSIFDHIIHNIKVVKNFCILVSCEQVEKQNRHGFIPGKYIQIAIKCEFSSENNSSFLLEEQKSALNFEISLLRAFMSNLEGYLLFEDNQKNNLTVRMYFPDNTLVNEAI